MPKDRKFAKVWITNASQAEKQPILTLAIKIAKQGFNNDPIHFTKVIEGEDVILNLSFLKPEDLYKLEEAITLAKVANFDSKKMNDLFTDQDEQQIKYAFGIEREKDQFGMIYGPVLELSDVMSINPISWLNEQDYEQHDIYLFELSKETGERIIYKWDKVLVEWITYEEEGNSSL